MADPEDTAREADLVALFAELATKPACKEWDPACIECVGLALCEEVQRLRLDLEDAMAIQKRNE